MCGDAGAEISRYRLPGHRLGSLNPSIVLLDKVNKALHRLVLRDIELYSLFPDIEVNLSGSATDIPKVGVSHFARTVNNASHHGNTDTLEVARCFADSLGSSLEIKEGSPAARTSHIIGLEDPGSGGL